jgi:hypothetical protein
MTTADDFRAIVGRLRSWGFTVREQGGCYGRSNGSSWTNGKPDGHGNHHYVCSLNPEQSYIDGLVANLTADNVVNWFADVNGCAYLIGTGPMNHFGTGNSSVLALTRKDQAPPGPASSPGDMSGNQSYSGTECQHIGDSTPWPTPLVDVMVAINASEFLQWGYSADRAINHFEWTNRKIDMSAAGGPSSTAAGIELRRRVAAQMTGSPTQPPEDDDMPYTEQQMKDFAEAGARAFAATQEFRDRVMQACNESLKRNAGAATAQAKTGSQQFAATPEFHDRVMVACRDA